MCDVQILASFMEQERQLASAATSLSLPKKRRVAYDDSVSDDTCDISEVQNQFQHMDVARP